MTVPPGRPAVNPPLAAARAYRAALLRDLWRMRRGVNRVGVADRRRELALTRERIARLIGDPATGGCRKPDGPAAGEMATAEGPHAAGVVTVDAGIPASAPAVSSRLTAAPNARPAGRTGVAHV